jgi:hypothetical protein
MKAPETGVLNDLLIRAGDTETFEAWRTRGRATGWCRHPVRLTGATRQVDAGTGEVRSVFSSSGLPDGVLLKACQQRRATLCPTCSATYGADAFQLVSSGLRGGKGIPETIADHPAVFATLTAPTFGAVHSAAKRGAKDARCRPDAQGTCTHGRPRTCADCHDPRSPILGQPICAECFDYPGAVVWNALAGELWRRTTIRLRRSLARRAGVPASRLPEVMRVSFAKVVEYQRRGVVHVHAVIRLDPIERDAMGCNAEELTLATLEAVRAVTVPCPESPGLIGPIRWGEQCDVQVLGHHGLAAVGAAGYIAKYITKSTDPGGVLDRRLKADDISQIEALLSPHIARLVRIAWDLGGRPELAHLRLRAWAHTLGFRGHWLTKSRAYSTTFAALRSARQHWHARHGEHDQTEDVTVGAWQFAGRGWTSPGDAWLAESAANEMTRVRRAAREERRGTTGSAPDGGAA